MIHGCECLFNVLFKNGVCAGQHLAVHEQVPPLLRIRLYLLVATQTGEVQAVIELRRELGVRKALFMGHDLLDDLGVVGDASRRRVRLIRLSQGLLQSLDAPDGLLVLDVERIALASDPLLAVLLVDDVGHVGQELGHARLLERGEVKARQGGDAGIVLAHFKAEFGEACLEEVDAGLVLVC